MNRKQNNGIAKFSRTAFQLVKSNPGFIAVVILMVLGISLYGDMFFDVTNIGNTLHTASMMGIMGLGVNLVFLIGGRDLSVGAIGALTSMMAAIGSYQGIFQTVFYTLAAGMLCGFVNGVIVTKLKVSAFIATLGTQLAFRSIALLVNNELPIQANRDFAPLNFISNGTIGGIVPFPAFLFIVLIIFFVILCKYTPFGRTIYAVGGSEEAAGMMGVRVDRTKLIVFAISGLLAGISGLILSGRLRAGMPTACVGWEMTIMAAIVIGGTRVRGGVGNVSGIFFGCLFVTLITNIINLNGEISPFWRDIITGTALLAVILYQNYTDNKRQDVHSSKKTIA